LGGERKGKSDRLAAMALSKQRYAVCKIASFFDNRTEKLRRHASRMQVYTNKFELADALTRRYE